LHQLHRLLQLVKVFAQDRHPKAVHELSKMLKILG
jgi:hypothetical protein